MLVMVLAKPDGLAMANVFTPNGFTPVRRLDGAAWNDNMTARKIAHDNTHKFYRGDPVVQLSTGYIDDVAIGSIPTQGTYGIFLGCTYLSTATKQKVWSPTFQGADTTTDVTAYVCIDPMVVFRCWVGTGASSAAGGPATIANISANYNWQIGTGNALSGISGAYLDFAGGATTNTFPLTLIGLVETPPGANGTDITTVGNMVEVVLNQQAFKVGTTGVAT